MGDIVRAFIRPDNFYMLYILMINLSQNGRRDGWCNHLLHAIHSYSLQICQGARDLLAIINSPASDRLVSLA